MKKGTGQMPVEKLNIQMGMHTMVFITKKIAQKVAVVGVGGAGCNVLRILKETNYPATTIAINTDKKALGNAAADQKLYICKEVLNGKGAHGDVAIGKTCAETHIDEVRKSLAGYDMVFVVSGLGGGTGTGATPAIIDAAQSQGIMTFAIAIKPFFFEGSRVEIANEGYDEISSICERSMAIENDLIVNKMGDMTLDEAFHEINKMVMEYIDSCMPEYVNIKEDRDGFKMMVRNSPLFAFTNA